MLPAPQGPLTGITVVASTVQIAGNFAAMLLGLYGARVIHVESTLGSDPVRGLGGPRKTANGVSLWQKFVHANMLQVTINLKHDRGKEVFRRLVRSADVFIESSRPGAMDRLGFPDEELRRGHPALVITHVSGYGRTGPLAGQAGYGTALGALSGYPNINGHPETGPTFLQSSFEDLLAGWAASHATLAAVVQARSRGEGAVVDTSLFEPVFFTLMADVMMAHDKQGHLPALTGNTLDYAAPRGVYRSRDGRALALSASSQPVWERLAAAIGRADLIGDPRFVDNGSRVANNAALDAIVGAWFAGREAAEILRIMADPGVDVPCEVILTAAEIREHPHYQARESFKRVPDQELGELLMPSAPARISSGGEVAFAGQPRGIHTDEVLRELSYSTEEIEALRREGAI